METREAAEISKGYSELHGRVKISQNHVQPPLLIHPNPFLTDTPDQFSIPTISGDKRGTNIMGFFGRYVLLVLPPLFLTLQLAVQFVCLFLSFFLSFFPWH